MTDRRGPYCPRRITQMSAARLPPIPAVAAAAGRPVQSGLRGNKSTLHVIQQPHFPLQPTFRGEGVCV